MRAPIYQYEDYKAYLKAFLSALPKGGHGFRSRIASVAGCRTAYVSQVLNGSAEFSLEQADAMCSFLQLSGEESEYFLLLVQLARAGTPSLKQRLISRMQKLRKNALNLKQRLRLKSDIGETDLIEFFSAWYFSAVQIATTIPRLRSRRKLEDSLRLSPALVGEAIQFLAEKGFVSEENGRLEPKKSKFLLGTDSRILKTHHANWRLRAIQSLDEQSPKDLHFTSIYSISRADAALLRELLVETIANFRKTAAASAEEELHTFCLDFFRVDR